MSHDVISFAVAVLLDAVIFIVLFIVGGKGKLLREPGWLFIHAGIGLMLVGDLSSLLEVVTQLDPFKGSVYYVVDALYLAGYISLIYGGSRWLPIVLDRRRIERELRQSEERFTEAQRVANIGSWEWNPQTDKMICTDEMFRIMGIEHPNEFECTFESFLNCVHQEDRDSVRSVINKAITNRSTYSVFHRITLPGDTIRFVLQQGRLIAEGSRGQQRVSGTIQDITEKQQAEDALRESEGKYRAVVENVQDGIIIVDDKYRIMFANPKVSEITGFAEEEILAQDFRQFILRDSLTPVVEKFDEFLTGTETKASREIKITRKDGKIQDLEVSASILDPQPYQFRILARITDITERKKIEEQLHSLSAHLQSAREEIQMTLSREIHDELGQELTALQMDLSWIRKRLPEKQADLQEKAESMSQLLHSTIQTVKRLSSKLRSPVLDLGVVAALEWEAEEFQEHTGIRCQLAITPNNVKLEPDLSTAVYRIFQETLTNVARHAQADKVDAKLEVTGGNIVLEIKDNGIGISDDKISDSRSFGIIGTRERVNQFGGDIHFGGRSGEGTTVIVTIPLNE